MEGEEGNGLRVKCPTFSFALWGSIVFEGTEGGGSVSIVDKEGGFEVGRRE